MKNLIFSIILLAIAFTANTSFAQTVNWRSIHHSDRHILNLNAGWEYAATFGIGYGYKLNTKIPLVLGTEFSLPSGEELTDDFKTKIGAQAEVFRHNNISATVKIHGIFRRYQSEFVTLQNFGSEMSAAIGYYKPRWYAAGEFGFDKAVVTHIRHSGLMEEYNPEIKRGWYIPTGGNFFYGLQGGYTMSSYDLYVKAGKILTQDFKTTPTVPFYLQLGLNKRF